MSLPCLKFSIDSPSPTEYSRRFLSVADKSLPSDHSPAANLQTWPHIPTYHPTAQLHKASRHTLRLSRFLMPLPLGVCFSSPLIPVPFLVTRQIFIKHYRPSPACPRNHQQSGAPLPNGVSIPRSFLSLLQV